MMNVARVTLDELEMLKCRHRYALDPISYMMEHRICSDYREGFPPDDVSGKYLEGLLVLGVKAVFEGLQTNNDIDW
jgi:hypothetical protein